MMKIVDAGHIYKIKGYDGSGGQLISFMKREGDRFPFNSESHSGTNCQEVLRALINRCEYLQSQSPCSETESIIGLLKTSLMLFETRAARLHELSLSHLLDLDLGVFVRCVTCEKCGHAVCNCTK